jgi:hypothetical protein
MASALLLGRSMQTAAGIFATGDTAHRAARALQAGGIARDRISVLLPGEARHARARVPTDEGEQPGTGAVIGGVVGAAVGAPIGAALSVVIPGVGPIIAFGLLGAALFGAGGAAVGDALEDTLATGLPRDELFLYEDALRQGRAVVVAVVPDDASAAAVRQILDAEGAERVDAARERWWIGLRDVEAERYGATFARDEAAFRRGFEAALHPAWRGAHWDVAAADLRARYGAEVDGPAFRRGWDRGQAYHAQRTEPSRRIA